MAEIKIKSTHPESQGDHVIIEEEDFDPAKGHELFESEKVRAKPGPKPKVKDEA